MTLGEEVVMHALSPTNHPTNHTTDLTAVRRRRSSLRAAMHAVEGALAGPAPGRVAEWADGLQGALGALREVYAGHVAATESSGGFLDEIVERAPRLANPVRRMREEHATIESLLARAMTWVTRRSAGDEDGWVLEARGRATALLAALARHGRRGADLVYEAYDVDIGGD